MHNSPLAHPLRTLLPLGALQGLATWLILLFWPDPPAQKILSVALLHLLLLGTLSLELCVRDGLTPGKIKLSLLLATGVSLVYVWLGVQNLPGAEAFDNGSDVLIGSWCLGLVMLSYILIPFIQSWPTREAGRFRYTDLYRHAWDNILILWVSGLVTGIFWLLIALWAGLFEMLGTSLFSDLFYSMPFALIASALVFAAGLNIGIQKANIITTLREILLSICRLLLPMAVLIALLFAASLPLTGLQPIWNTGYSTPILLTLTLTLLFLVNGVFQDGQGPAPYPRWLQAIINASLLLMPVFALLSAYSLYLRIDQYGLTPERVWSLVIIGVVLAYGLSYSLTVLQGRQPWLGGIRRINQWLALMVACLILLLHLPLLNPLWLSAHNQYQRLVSGEVPVGQFDFGLLKFKLGQPGLAYLEQLRGQLSNDSTFTGEQRQTIQANLTQLDKASHYWDWREAKDALPEKPRLEWLHGQPLVGDEQISPLLASGQCRREACTLLAVDLTRDGIEELVLLDPERTYEPFPVFQRDAKGDWLQVGKLGDPASYSDDQSLWLQRLKERHYRTVIPAFDSLQIDEHTLEFHTITGP